MTTIVPIDRFASTGHEPDPEIINELSDLLERAKRGEVRSFAYVAIDGGGNVGSCWIQGNAVAAVLVGGVDKLHHELVDNWISNNK